MPMEGSSMAKIEAKTAILVQQSLLERMDKLARELNISRSQLFARAVDEFLRRHQGEDLVEALNRAYESSSDPEEEEQMRRMRHLHRRAVEGEW
jgi:metal-responsive CopG/Arc/MetJ family transcriptional regulator